MKKITVDQSKVLKNRPYWLFRFFWATRYKSSVDKYTQAPVDGWNCTPPPPPEVIRTVWGKMENGTVHYNWGGYSSQQRLARRVYLFYVRHRLILINLKQRRKRYGTFTYPLCVLWLRRSRFLMRFLQPVKKRLHDKQLSNHKPIIFYDGYNEV